MHVNAMGYTNIPDNKKDHLYELGCYIYSGHKVLIYKGL